VLFRSDRFGKIPWQTESLLDTIRLRWLARSIGFEKLVLRNQRLTAYFITNEESSYFQSPQFTFILEFMKTNPKLFGMKEEKNRLYLIFSGISSISQAVKALAVLRDPELGEANVIASRSL
jgi:transcription-repair coupling factor (superfamily II helicase)